MQNTAENPFTYMCSHMEIHKVFPIEEIPINYHRHEIDNLLKQLVENIKSEKAYKFLNNMETDAHIRAIHTRQKLYAEMLAATLMQEEKCIIELLKNLNIHSLCTMKILNLHILLSYFLY